jgi:hypothetical protein
VKLRLVAVTCWLLAGFWQPESVGGHCIQERLEGRVAPLLALLNIEPLGLIIYDGFFVFHTTCA